MSALLLTNSTQLELLPMKKHKFSWMRLKALNTLFLFRYLFIRTMSNEIYNAQIDGKFIVVTNSKRNNHYNKYQCIPITPALIPYFKETNFSEIPAKLCLQLKIKEVLPDHTICALRHTFRKRCQKVGIPPVVIASFMGLTSRELTDEVLLEAAEKLRDGT